MQQYDLYAKTKKWIDENKDKLREFIREIVTGGDCLGHTIYLRYKDDEIQLGDLQSIGTRTYFDNYDNIAELLYIDELNYLHERYEDELEYAIEDIKSRDSVAEIDKEYFDHCFWGDTVDWYFEKLITNLHCWEKDLKHQKYMEEKSKDWYE